MFIFEKHLNKNVFLTATILSVSNDHPFNLERYFVGYGPPGIVVTVCTMRTP